MNPTPKAEWVKAGDRCASPAGMKGEVLRVKDTGSVPYAVVKWENGHTGRMTITLLVRI